MNELLYAIKPSLNASFQSDIISDSICLDIIYIYIIKTLHFIPDVSAEHSLSQWKILLQ
jgi:hypothetical protein